MRFLPTLTQIFLWWAIYDVISNTDTTNSGTRPDGNIAGYKYGDMVAYYLLVIISRAFSSMPGLTGGIANQIRNGEVKKFLIQPVDMQGCLLIQRLAHKLVYYLIATLPFALVFFLCRDFFIEGWPPPNALAVFFASLILSFLLGFYLECCIGLIGFWFLEVTSLTFNIHVDELFTFGAHVSPGIITRGTIQYSAAGRVPSIQISGLFPGSRVSWKNRRPRNVSWSVG